ncbi:dihydrolipoamide dehydrogenase [Cytobacillus eiseniae]|uniref:Dihydrolipoyl dehydrogenase n=1 Tax=Cytobacillus eiseniae TaxID=762947 RepID=A0ABS4RHD1_9BACI|nr:dihydrolipoyl dehydrogenase [Cytobacillus eiseniae]MBP2242322.1 dihydrolipoamide dehydrogenase [Cytobacillus eiseniae]
MVVGELAYERDLIIIGGGPGGYNAAIRAAQLGQSVTLIEREELGGVCLNIGCIPTKVLTEGAEKLRSTRKAADFGIETNSIEFNLAKLQNYKLNTILQLREGVTALCKANKVELIKGSAFFLSEDRLGVESGDHYEVYRFKQAIIATGSSPKIPKGLKVDHVQIVDSWSITKLSAIPEKLFVLGSDYIALEMAMAFSVFGSAVTILLDGEDFPFDQSINMELMRLMKKNKIKIIKNVSISEAYVEQNTVSIYFGNEKMTGTHLFISLGHSPNIENLGIDRIGIKRTNRDFIEVNQQCRTSIPTIYAIGDVTEGPHLASKAIKQGKTAAEAIAGLSSEVDLRFLPIIAQTTPPIASVGLTEQEAIKHGYEVDIGQFPLSANGFAGLRGEKEGFIKVITDKKTSLFLGMHILGYGAIELITSGILSLEMAARDEDLLFPAYPHPSVNECIAEAFEAIKKQAIHIPPMMKREKSNV